jgi:hypothetical protein
MRRTLCIVLAAATLAGSLSGAQALPMAAAAGAVRAEVAAADATLRQDAQYYYRRHYYHRPYRYHRGDAALGVVGGLAAGALIAGAIASSQAQPLHRTQDPDYIAYCSRKYRSFDPQSGTYLARDGLRYPCE